MLLKTLIYLLALGMMTQLITRLLVGVISCNAILRKEKEPPSIFNSGWSSPDLKPKKWDIVLSKMIIYVIGIVLPSEAVKYASQD